MPTVSERITRLEERLADLRHDFDVHVTEAVGRSESVKRMELVTDRLVEAQKAARRAEDSQYRRLELRLQRQTVAVAVAGVLVAVVSLVVAFHGG